MKCQLPWFNNRACRLLSCAVTLAVIIWSGQTADAAITFAQQRAAHFSGSSGTLAFASNTTAGDLILVGFYFGPGVTVSAVSDSQGNVFAQIGTALSTPSGKTSAALFYAKNIRGGADSVTVALSGVPQVPGMAMFIFEYKGVNTIAPLDGVAQAQGPSGSVSSGNLAATVSGDLLFGFCISDSTCSKGTGFTARSTFENNVGEDKLGINAGATSATATSNAPWSMHAAAFKPVSADTIPPSTPTGLTATPVSIGQINLAWNASTDPNSPVAGYRIYRNSNLTGAAADTSYSDIGLAANTTYSYTVSAYDAAGNASAQSASVSGTTLADTTPPSIPTGLTATPVSTTQINLFWAASTDPDSPVAGYNIYRNSFLVGTAAGTSYVDSGLTAESTYSYAVSAYDGAGNVSSNSAEVSATTPAPDTTAPSIPTGLTAFANSAGQISLSWSASTDPEGPVAGYKIYRDNVRVGSSVTASYVDTGLSPVTAYSYAVTAYDAAENESGRSEAVSATTQAAISAQIRQEYGIGYVEVRSFDSQGFIHLDTDALDGSVSYYFEVSQLTPSLSNVCLRRKGTTIDDACIAMDGVTNHVQRSNAFTPPAGATDYDFYDPYIDYGDYMVRVVALQSNFTKTQTQVELDTDANSTYPYSSTAYGTASPFPSYWKYTAANWAGNKTFSWEIVWKTSSGSAPASAQLQTSVDGISWSAVGADVTTASTTATRTRTTFNPTDGNVYRIMVHSFSGSSSVTGFAYRIIVDQTDAPTRLEGNYVIANSRWCTSSANDAAAKWVQSDWSGTTNIYKHRNATGKPGVTDVIRLYGMTDAAILGGSTNTSDGTIMVTSGPVAMPSTDQIVRYDYTPSPNSSCVSPGSNVFVDSRILVLVSVP